MKILDRYILSTFLKNYLIAFMVLVGLYIVMDMVMQFDELAENQVRAGESGVQSAIGLMHSTADYYFYQMFVYFVHLSAMIPVVAATFTLVRLVRFNELTAMLACGVPLLRISAPIIIASLILNALLLVDQEVFIPKMIPKLVRKHDEIRATSGPHYPIYSMRDKDNGLLVAARYHPPSTAPAQMDFVDFIERDDELRPVSHLSADHAEWDAAAQRWKLDNGKRIDGLGPADLQRTEKPTDTFETSITPDEISLYRSGNFVQWLSTERINALLERPQSYGTVDLLRVKHFRFTQPLANIIILLLAVACVLTREPGQLKNGIIKSAVFTGACMASIFIAQNLAGQPPNSNWIDTWPALMAWLPLIIFGPIAVWLLDRIKT